MRIAIITITLPDETNATEEEINEICRDAEFLLDPEYLKYAWSDLGVEVEFEALPDMENTV